MAGAARKSAPTFELRITGERAGIPMSRELYNGGSENTARGCLYVARESVIASGATALLTIWTTEHRDGARYREMILRQNIHQGNPFNVEEFSQGGARK